MAVLTLQHYSYLYFVWQGKDGSLEISLVQHNEQQIKTRLLFIFNIHPKRADLSELQIQVKQKKLIYFQSKMGTSDFRQLKFRSQYPLRMGPHLANSI